MLCIMERRKKEFLGRNPMGIRPSLVKGTIVDSAYRCRGTTVTQQEYDAKSKDLRNIWFLRKLGNKYLLARSLVSQNAEN